MACHVDLVGPKEVPDFSDIPVYKLIAFFREAKFESLSMLPFRAQYLPTNTSNEESNAELIAEKEKANEDGQKWTSKYLFHIPMPKGKTKQDINDTTSSNQSHST